MLKVTVKKFDALTSNELYQLLRLRSQVFVVEQNCVYLDVDDKDQKALHCFLIKNNKIIGYSRLFDAGDYFKQASIGRIAVHKDYRDNKLGHLLLKESVNAIKTHYNTTEVTISAQTYLRSFYESHNFVQRGNEYLEDGIPHVKMFLINR